MHGRFTAFKEHVADEAKRRVVVPVDRRAPTRHRLGSLRSRRRSARLPRRTRMATRVPALLRRATRRHRACLIANAALCLGTLDRQSSPVAPSHAAPGRRRQSAGRPSGATSRLPAAAGSAARDARALGALSRVRHRLRNRRARPARRAAAHAGGAPRGELHLLDLIVGRPRLRRDEPVDRRPRVRVRNALAPRTPDPVGSAEASREAAEGAAAGAAAGSAELRGVEPASPATSQRAIWCRTRERGTLNRMSS